MLTQDPIGLAGGVNLYAYAGNNPTSFSDPFGLCAESGGSDTTRYQSRYNHLDESCVTKGQKVAAGDTIGYSGNSGELTTGPHLHFEFRRINNGVKGDATANSQSTAQDPLYCFGAGYCGSPLESSNSTLTLTSGFGMRTHPVTGNQTNHLGNDFRAPMRTPVLATHAGTVVFSGTISGGGLSIYINH